MLNQNPKMSKVILVTGASSGIGLASATALHNAGHTVYGTTRNISKAKSVPFKLLELDVTSDESAEAAVASIIKAEGKIDVLVNSAGISHIGKSDTTNEEDFDKIKSLCHRTRNLATAR